MSEQLSERDWEYCRKVLPKVSRTFAINIGELEGDIFKAVLLGYLLFRIADTFEDTVYRHEEEKIGDLRDFSAVFTGSKDLAQRLSLYESLRFRWNENSHEKILIESGPRVLRCYFTLPGIYRGIIDPLIVETTEGMTEFLRRKVESGCEIFQLKDIRDLEDYCYYVAGVVGVMLTRIFCQKESVERKRSELERFQIDFGLGLQLINIVKDYSKDIARGWCYIPHTVTDKHGIKLGDIRDLSDKQRQGVLRDMVPLVVPYLDSTLRYITLLPTAERSIRMFCIIPFVIAYKTLAKILNGEANKISRAEVTSIREQSDACARSSSLLEEDYMNTKKHYFGIADHVS